MGNPPEDVSGIKLKISVANALISTEDKFVLKFVDEETFLANESQKAREELARMSSLSNDNESLPIEQVEDNTIETAEVDEAIEVEETPPEPIEAAPCERRAWQKHLRRPIGKGAATQCQYAR